MRFRYLCQSGSNPMGPEEEEEEENKKKTTQILFEAKEWTLTEPDQYPKFIFVGLGTGFLV